MSDRLTQLNQLSADEAEQEFLKCCGSKRWAQILAAARPFADASELFSKADDLWWSLSEADWLEAFQAHPKIGEKKAAVSQSAQAQSWSSQEQSGVADASADTISQLAQRNREYEDRFGFIFIVCATAKSADEMLSIINARIQNDRETELRGAAEEQRKITRLRLQKLIS
jgi:OHCU decarboxylase